MAQPASGTGARTPNALSPSTSEPRTVVISLAEIGQERLELTQVHRFSNGGVRVGRHIYWDALGLYRGVLEGLRSAGRSGRLDRSGSTRGGSTTVCSTPTGPYWATLSTTGTTGPGASSSRSSRQCRGTRALPPLGHSGCTLQHDLPARRWPGRRPVPTRGTLLLMPDLLACTGSRDRSAARKRTLQRPSCSASTVPAGTSSFWAG